MTVVELGSKVRDSSAFSSTCSSEDEGADTITNWKCVVLAGLVGFLGALENTAIGVSEWPYMHQIDPMATSQFFGLVSSISKCGHAFFALVFSYWCYKAQSFRQPLVAGRVIAFLACCLYLCVEFLPEGRRYLMLVCYFLFGVASSSATVLRVYIVLVSSKMDRARAYSAIILANMFSIVIGPIIQLCFTHITYPGYEIVPGKVRFHIYSAPIWLASITNFVSVAIICTVFKELPKKIVSKGASVMSLEEVMRRLRAVASLDLVWSLVFLCWIMKIIGNIALVTLQTTVSPLMMTSFGWDGSFTVQVMAVCMGVVGILSFGVAGAFMTPVCSKIISPRVAFLISLLISVTMYLLSYPYPRISHAIPEYNATTGTGCSPLEYSWCFSGQATWPTVFLPVVVLVMGIGMPLAAISLDTIYSKVLGAIDQSVMQGCIVVAEDVVLILGPLYASTLFTAFGQGVLWISNGVITIGGCLLWLAYFGRLGQFK